MISPNLEPPVSLGTDFVDHAIFPALREMYDNKGLASYGVTCWPHDIDSGWDHQRSTLEILGLLTNRLLQYSTDTYGQPVERISYEIHAHDVELGRMQTAYNGDTGRWHIDAGEPSLGDLFVSDSLPTEFLVTTPKKGWRANKARQKLLSSPRLSNFDFDPIAVQKAIEKGVYSIYTPQPYEAVIGNDHLHQSPINPGPNTIQRVWLRAVLFSTPS